MTKNSDIIFSKIVFILIFISLTTIFGCDGDNWDFDLFGGDTTNGNGGDGNGNNGIGNNGNGKSGEFSPAVFSATIGGTKINEPVELFSSFDNGTNIIELTGVVTQSGAEDEDEGGDEFKVSPDGKLVAYLIEEDDGRIELFVVPVEGGDKTRISEDDADVTEFDWSPDGNRIAYLADGETDDLFELYTNRAEGGDNIKVSGGGLVKAFEWSPDNSYIAYTAADQDNLEESELFTTPPTESEPVKVSETVSQNKGGVTEFSWSSGSSRVAYLSDPQSADLFELFTSLPRESEDPDPISEDVQVLKFAWAPDKEDEILAYSTEGRIYTALPDGGNNTRITPDLTDDGSISDFSWAPDSTRIAYLANQSSDEAFELFTVRPDGSGRDNSDKSPISGELKDDRDVTDFSWAPDSTRIAYLADKRTDDDFELFTVEPDGNDDLRISGNLTDDGDVIDFSWAPNSKRVAYRADQKTDEVIELFTSTPDGQEKDRVSDDLANGGNVGQFLWDPNDSGIGYIADQETDEVFELFASTPNGDKTAKLSGSFAEDEDGDVLFFEWAEP